MVWVRVVAAAALFGLGLSGIETRAWAEDQGTTGISAASPALRKLLLADDLVELGRETSDPVLLIAAARLLPAASPTTIRDGDLDAGPTAAALLDEAIALSGNRPVELSLAQRLKADLSSDAAKAQRGLLNALGDGAAFVTKLGTLGPNKTFKSPVWTFAGGAYAEVHVKGRGRGNVDVYVRTADGKLICADKDSANESYCGWNPRKTEGFVITVENRSGVATPFRLTTN